MKERKRNFCTPLHGWGSHRAYSYWSTTGGDQLWWGGNTLVQGGKMCPRAAHTVEWVEGRSVQVRMFGPQHRV